VSTLTLPILKFYDKSLAKSAKIGSNSLQVPHFGDAISKIHTFFDSRTSV